MTNISFECDRKTVERSIKVYTTKLSHSKNKRKRKRKRRRKNKT